MDNSQFLSFFWGLSDENTNEQIVQSAESIVNLVESKQKFEHDKKVIDRERFKLYLNVCENPTEDILYTFKRLIGGIASTGVSSRRGFVLTFSLLIEKFSNLVNFNEMINIIEKETLVSKSEKNHIKNCFLTGKLLMYKSLLDLKTLQPEYILNIFKILFELVQIKVLEEAILQTLNDFLVKLKENFYFELQDSKKLNRFFDKFLNQLNKILVNKSNFESMKNLYEFSLIFTLLSHKDLSSSIGSFLHTNTLQNLINENSLLNFFKLVLSCNIRENEFHVSFRYFLNLLKSLNDFSKVVEVWNILIEGQIQESLKTVSPKNFQFLIYSVSKFILENYFIFKYIKQIFDSSFFETLLKFSSNKKFKYIGSLVETLMNKLKNQNESEKEDLSHYCLDLLNVFGNEGRLSPQSYKNFFVFLFNNLDENQKVDYIQNLCTEKVFDEEEGREEDIDVENLTFRIAAFKQLMISGDTRMSKNLKNKIVEFFFKEYLNEAHDDVEISDLVEDRLLLVIFAYMRVPKDDVEEEGSVKSIKDSKMVKLLMQIHKLLQKSITTKVIEDIEVEDYKIYSKFYKKFTGLVAIKTEEVDKERLDKLYSITKIGLVCLILFLKNPTEYSDILSDLFQVSQFKVDWQKVYMDIIISLIHKGNNTLSDFIMNCFRKVSKYLNMDSLNVLIDFLSQTKSEKEELDESIEDEENSEENGITKKPNLIAKTKMFQDLAENDGEDVQMSDS